MTQDNHILFAYEFDGKGKGTKLEGDAVAQKIKQDVLAWAHLDVNHPQTRQWLQDEASYLDPLILDALLAKESRPRVTEYPEGYLIILRGVNLNQNAEEEDMVSIRMWIDQHRIISTRLRKLKSVQSIREKLEAGTGPKNSADFITLLVTELLNKMEPVIAELDDATDKIEQDLIEQSDELSRAEINDIRKKAILLRRYISPQKEALAHFRTSDVPWMNERHMRAIQEQIDKNTRLVEDLDSIRERGQIIKDELSNTLSERMNKNLYVLSLIAALFLPLGFLTGLLGINVGGMPGVDSSAAFWVVCFLCCGVFALEYIIFRKLRWL
ncbi:MAG: zinc transporter ZntB [Bdellovibrionales bacterium]